jgi:branched-chain amino acid transport system ATP-binding protein
VLFGVDIEVGAGEAVALLGTNGAGKSTLLRAITGLQSPSAGRVEFLGEDVTGLPPERIALKGLTLVEGGRAIFPSLSVEENLRLGGYPDLRRKRADVERRLEHSYAVFPILADLRRRAAGTLSGGEQQLVALGRALVAEPKLLMVDELSLGLAPVVLQQLVQAVATMAAEGVAVLLVEQSINVAAAVSTRAYYMEKGEVRFSGPPADLLERGDLVRSVFFGAAAAGAR